MGLKNIMKGEEYNFSYFQHIFNPKTYNKCKGCDLYKVCNAGCTYSQIRNGNKPVDSICELFHMYYDEAIRNAAAAAVAQDDDMHSPMDDAEADAAVRLATGDESDE